MKLILIGTSWGDFFPVIFHISNLCWMFQTCDNSRNELMVKCDENVLVFPTLIATHPPCVTYNEQRSRRTYTMLINWWKTKKGCWACYPLSYVLGNVTECVRRRLFSSMLLSAKQLLSNTSRSEERKNNENRKVYHENFKYFTRNWNQIKLFHFREFSMTRAVGMLLLKALYMITSMAFQSEFSAHNVAQIFGLEYVVPAACERWVFHLLKLSFVKVLYCKLEHQSTTTFLIVSAKIFPRSVGPMKGFIWFLIMGWVNMH